MLNIKHKNFFKILQIIDFFFPHYFKIDLYFPKGALNSKVSKNLIPIFLKH
jgi:hypothetical protein